jgi:hypothetical protein
LVVPIAVTPVEKSPAIKAVCPDPIKNLFDIVAGTLQEIVVAVMVVPL